MKSIKFYTDFIRERLSPSRFTHSVQTAEMSRELAIAHGLDPDKAYFAGILHDVCKEDGEKELKRLAFSKTLEKLSLPLDPLEKKEPKLWHAPAGAVYIKEAFGIDDLDLIAAVRFHTVGRAGMSGLEKIIYLGDLVEHGRDYADVDEYRRYAFHDLTLGMCEALKWAINNNMQKDKRISRYTYEAYNYYVG